MRCTIRDLLPVLLILLPSCQKNPAGPGNGTASATYPMDLGHTWTYEGLGRMFNLRMSDTSVPFTPDTIAGIDVVSITRQLRLPVSATDPLDSILVLEFRDDHASSGPVPAGGTGYSYMSMTNGALLLHGYREGSGSALPAAPREEKTFVLNGDRYSSVWELTRALTGTIRAITSDSIVREVPPLIALRYPLVVGAVWNFRPQGHPWRIDKQVIGDTIVFLAGRAFQAARVRWLYDTDGDGKTDTNLTCVDCIAPEGMVMRTLLVRNIVVTTAEHPDGIGVCDFEDTYILTSVQPLTVAAESRRR